MLCYSLNCPTNNILLKSSKLFSSSLSVYKIHIWWQTNMNMKLWNKYTHWPDGQKGLLMRNRLNKYGKWSAILQKACFIFYFLGKRDIYQGWNKGHHPLERRAHSPPSLEQPQPGPPDGGGSPTNSRSFRVGDTNAGFQKIGQKIRQEDNAKVHGTNIQVNKWSKRSMEVHLPYSKLWQTDKPTNQTDS